MKCEGPFEKKIINENDRSESEEHYSNATAISTRSEEQAKGNAHEINIQIEDEKMKWMMKVLNEMKNEMIYKSLLEK